MKSHSILTPLSYATLFALLVVAAWANPDDRTVVLSESGVKNLRIETTSVEKSVFEESVFALGRIYVSPGHRAIISSRISGRATEVFLRPHHTIQKGEPALIIESRQPGNPPPTITLAAPLSGMVSNVQVAPGEPVEPDRSLAEILDISEVYAIAYVPEHLTGQLRKGQRARISAPAVPGKVFHAELEHLGAVINPETHTVEAAFEVPNPEHVLRPGMRAEFSIVVDTKDHVFSIPRAALQGDPANRFVYVRHTTIPHAFVKTPVVVGRTNDRIVEILDGLSVGDAVVTQGAYSLSFVGSGSTTSLKDALDAAHGHAHAEDGSELTDSHSSSHEHDSVEEDSHHEESASFLQNRFWVWTSAILLILLLLSLFRKKGNSHVE